MSEELTLEGVAEIADIDFNQLEDIARAHLSRPVIGDEQMRDGIKIATMIAKHGYETVGKTSACVLANTVLTMSEQLAAEQEKVKALQPYKDAYEAGEDVRVMPIGGDDALNLALLPKPEYPIDTTVRVCKLVDGEL